MIHQNKKTFTTIQVYRKPFLVTNIVRRIPFILHQQRV